jgi:hypothetical protein
MLPNIERQYGDEVTRQCFEGRHAIALTARNENPPLHIFGTRYHSQLGVDII